MKPHKHAELIKQWADGAEIQSLHIVGDDWVDTKNPAWGSNDFKFRIKPEPKPDVVRYCLVDEFCIHGGWFLEITTTHEHLDNLKLTFDGETGELKSAEVLK